MARPSKGNKPTWNETLAMYPDMTPSQIRQMLNIPERKYPKKIKRLEDL